MDQWERTLRPIRRQPRSQSSFSRARDSILTNVPAPTNTALIATTSNSTRSCSTSAACLGSAAKSNTPGSRLAAASWADSNGNLWVFNGSVLDQNNALGLLFGGNGLDAKSNSSILYDLYVLSAGAQPAGSCNPSLRHSFRNLYKRSTRDHQQYDPRARPSTTPATGQH